MRIDASGASRFRLGAIALVALFWGAGAAAQTVPAPPSGATGAVLASQHPVAPLTLKEIAQQAITTNPEVLARWHTIRAAESERDAARGGLLPRVDLSATLGPERRNGLAENSRYGTTLSLTQLLYDGAATRNELRRLDYAARVRLFEFFETSENVALEAVRAYLDVLRYRELVALAENNFVEHRAVYTQIERRVTARVARGVDLEQIAGRLALAEANLMTEVANLHDTSARFQRLVGRQPTREMPVPALLARDIPPDMGTALDLAQQRHPSLLAAIENVRAAQASLATRSGAYVPRVDARLRREQGGNNTSLPSSSNATAAELVLSWNMFSGFADRSRERQFAEQLNVARDLRDKTCRDTRQTLLIAYNDILKLNNQLDHLVTHETAVGKALVAYRQQFDIGQRTLLDLLDTENELFQARRAVVNARYDLHLAHARTQAGIGNLLHALELTSLQDRTEADLASWSAGGDAARECPSEPLEVPTTDRSQLVQRAIQASARMGSLNARERAALEVALPTMSSPGPAADGSVPRPARALPGGAAAVPGAAAVSPRPAAPALAPDGSAEVASALEEWRSAWSARNVDAYLASYGPGFTPPGGLAREAWEQRRRGIIGRAAEVRVELREVTTTLQGADRATSTFIQRYQSAGYQDEVRKTLEWERVDGRWRIRAETTAPL